jgi:hypothetical protein
MYLLVIFNLTYKIVDHPVIISTLILPKSSEDMIDAQKRLGEYGYTFLFEKDKSKLDIMILDYEKREPSAIM